MARKTLSIPKVAGAQISVTDFTKLIAKPDNSTAYLDSSNVEHTIGIPNYGVTVHPKDLFRWTHFIDTATVDRVFKVSSGSYGGGSTDNAGTKSFGTADIYVPTGVGSYARWYTYTQKPITGGYVYETRMRFTNVQADSGTIALDNYLGAYAQFGYSNRTMGTSPQGVEICFIFEADVSGRTILLKGQCATDATNASKTATGYSLVNGGGYLNTAWLIMRLVISPNLDTVTFKIFSSDATTLLWSDSVSSNIPASGQLAYVENFTTRVATGNQVIFLIDYIGYGSSGSYKNFTGVAP